MSIAGIGQPLGHLVRMREQMSLRELKVLLDQVPDTRELVLRREASRGPDWNALYDAWSDAHEEAEGAWRTWRCAPSRDAYAAYRAAADREDAAQDAVAAVRR
jgi:hypothetical protein